MTPPINIIVVAYALADDLRTLYESVAHPEVALHIFLHSQFEDVVAVCHQLAERPNVTLYPYGVNRGLSKSWNEGLLNAYAAGADVVMIANDDAYAAPGDVFRIADAALAHRHLYAVSGMGLELFSGDRMDMLLSLCAMNPVALDVVGMYDENYFPIYFEDSDYARRAWLAGLERMCVQNTNIVHAGNKSRRTVPENAKQHPVTSHRNREYYARKWGGQLGGGETYTIPFNDSRFTLKIAPEDRHAPYPGYNRDDMSVVVV